MKEKTPTFARLLKKTNPKLRIVIFIGFTGICVLFLYLFGPLVFDIPWIMLGKVYLFLVQWNRRNWEGGKSVTDMC